MEILIDKLFDIFSVEYMFSVIIASYFIIKVIDLLNGEKAVPSWLKRTITCAVGMVLFFVFLKFTDTGVQCLITSFFSAIFIYDTAIKTLLKKLEIDYKK